MKILVIVHQFPPKDSAGTEVYTWKVTKGLQDRGHDVAVYFTSRDDVRPQYDLRKGTFDGLPVYDVVNNHEFTDFRSVYKDARMEEHLVTVLDEVQPDAVHIQHLHLHSIGYIALIKARGVPILFTLAEYLLICLRSWMVKMDFTLCEGPEVSECATCAKGLWPAPEEARAPRAQPKRKAPLHKAPDHVEPEPASPHSVDVGAVEPAQALDVAVAEPAQPLGPSPRYSLRRFLGKVRRRLAGPGRGPVSEAAIVPTVDTKPTLAALAASTPRVQKSVTAESSAAADATGAPWETAVERRWKEIKEGLDQVDLFIAPSRFLRDQFVNSGMVAPERIVYSDYGFDHEPFRDAAPRTAGTDSLRVGFIGSIGEQKGVHLLVEALNGLPESGIECLIYGDLGSFPEYSEDLMASRTHGGVKFMGRYPNDKIGEVLAGLDVLVVPSRWYENSPLTIHEAFMAGLPVITGDAGGMAELVGHEECGLQFRVGDAEDLRLQIQRLMLEPDLLGRLRAGIPRVKSIEEDAAEIEARFVALLEAGGTPG